MSGVTMTARQAEVYRMLFRVGPTTARSLAEKLSWRSGWNYDAVYVALTGLEKRGLVVRDGKIRNHYALAPQHLWRTTSDAGPVAGDSTGPEGPPRKEDCAVGTQGSDE